MSRKTALRTKKEYKADGSAAQTFIIPGDAATTAMTIHGITRAAYLVIAEWPGLFPVGSS